MSKRAVIYARVSYDDRDTENLPDQIDMGRDYCNKKGYELITVLAEDAKGASGAEINLPQLNKALEMAHNGLFDILVVRDLERFSRNVGKINIIEKDFNRHKIKVEYVRYAFPDTPEGNLNKNILAALAEYEREEIRWRMMRGRRDSVNNGKILVSNNGPYGYRKFKADDKHIFIKPYQPEAVIVRQIFNWYAVELLSINKIASRLDKMNIPLPQACGIKRTHGWPRSTIRKMLLCKTYIGEWRYIYSKAQKFNETAEHLSVEVESIVDKTLWDAAQVMLENNKLNHARETKHEYLFSRRLTCGNCGGPMYSFPQYTKGFFYHYYICSGENYNVGGACKGYRVRVDKIDNLAWNWLSTILKDPGKLQAEIDLFKTRTERECAPILEQIKIADDLLAENKKQLGRLIDLYMVGSYSLEIVQERKNRIELTIHSLEEQRSNLLSKLEGRTFTADQADNLQEFVAEIRDRLDTASYQEKKQLFNILNVTGMLEAGEGGKVFHVQCAIRPNPEKFMIDNTSTR